jgi:hypothetical protein
MAFKNRMWTCKDEIKKKKGLSWEKKYLIKKISNNIYNKFAN